MVLSVNINSEGLVITTKPFFIVYIFCLGNITPTYTYKRILFLSLCSFCGGMMPPHYLLSALIVSYEKDRLPVRRYCFYVARK